MKPVIYFPMYSLWILLYNGFKPKTSPRILTKYILGQCKTLQNEKKIGNENDGLYKFKGIISRLNLSILCKITHLESILCVVRVWRFYRLYKLHRCEMERESERSKAKVWQWHLLKALSLKKKKKRNFCLWRLSLCLLVSPDKWRKPGIQVEEKGQTDWHKREHMATDTCQQTGKQTHSYSTDADNKTGQQRLCLSISSSLYHVHLTYANYFMHIGAECSNQQRCELIARIRIYIKTTSLHGVGTNIISSVQVLLLVTVPIASQWP